MPKQDREAIKTLAIAVGVREAARKLGLNEDTVCSWAKRGKWFTPVHVPTPKSQAIDLQALQASPSQALATSLQELGKETKYSLARAAHKTAKHVESLEPKEILRQSQNVKHITGVASTVHGWDQTAGQQTTLSLNVLTNQAAIQIVSERGDGPQTHEDGA